MEGEGVGRARGGGEAGVYAGETEGLEDDGSEDAVENLVEGAEWVGIILRSSE